MQQRRYYITEVFAEGPFGGNQLATIKDAADLSTETMQQVARLFNFSETTFVTGGDAANGFDVRIFTPSSELPFAGHPTLGSAFVCKDEFRVSGEVTLNLGVGKIPVVKGDDGVLWMTQKSPEFGDKLPVATAAEWLGLPAESIDASAPCQYVSTGLGFWIVPLNGPDALAACVPGAGIGNTGILAFCRGGYEPHQQLSARMFAAGLGVVEDPATGSANGCLASWCVHHRYLGGPSVHVGVGQGYEIARPSTLFLDAAGEDEISVRVGGRVHLAATGVLNLP